MKTCDVIVIGGGSAGVIAAIQAARAKADTLLVEKTGTLGGTLTNAMVNFPGIFQAWGKPVIAGIGWELVEQTLREAGDPMPDYSLPANQFFRHQVSVNPYLFAALADEALHLAGVRVLQHTMVATVAFTGGLWHVTLCTKTGLQTVQSKTLVDCTGDANVVSLAGFPVDVLEDFQPATLIYRVGGYDIATLDFEAIERAADEALKRGELLETDSGWKAGGNVASFLRWGGGNANHLPGINARDSEGKTALEHAGKQAFLRLFRFLKKQPGLAGLKVLFMAAETGVRETTVIRGCHRITGAEYKEGVAYPDGLCHAYYPVDSHLRVGIHLEHLKPGVVPSIPRRALIPEGSVNLAVAGRSLSSDREANSALRVQAPCMAMGQAAGAMAALASKTGVPMLDLDMAAIHRLLQEHHAIVPAPLL